MPGRVVIFSWSDSVHIRRWVTGLTRRGFEIRLISLGGDPVDGVETINLPRTGIFPYYAQAKPAVTLAREFRPDLVHVHYAGGFGYWGARCEFAPLLVSVWGSDVVDLPRHPVYRHLIKRTLRRADYITATSEFLRRVSLQLAPEVEGKVEVIPFGVTIPEDITPFPVGPTKLCFIKMHRRCYAPDILLRAFAQARQKMPDLRLTMAGEGAMSAGLRRLASQLGVAEAIEFVGLIPHEHIFRLLEDHHLMVMPSLEEAFGVVVLEASACGRPVIASRVGGVPEVLRDGETGLLVPPKDVNALAQAIIELAGDRERCGMMGKAGREMVRSKYRWRQSLDRMTELYRRSIGDR